MKTSTLRIWFTILVLLTTSMLSSCSKNDEDLQSMAGSLWIHEFSPDENIVEVSALALYFGKSRVEYYALDEDFKVLRLINTFPYQVKERSIIMGAIEGGLTDNTLYFKNKMYYRSSKKITDIMPN